MKYHKTPHSVLVELRVSIITLVECNAILTQVSLHYCYSCLSNRVNRGVNYKGFIDQFIDKINYIAKMMII